MSTFQDITLANLAGGDAERKFRAVWPFIFNAFRHPNRADDKATITFTFHFELLDVEYGEASAWVDHPQVKPPKTSSRMSRVRLDDEGMLFEDEEEAAEEVVLPFVIPDPDLPEEAVSRSLREAPVTLSNIARGDAERQFQDALRQVWAALRDPERAEAKSRAKITLVLSIQDIDGRGKVLKATVKDCRHSYPGLKPWTGLIRLNPATGRGLVDLDEVEDGARVLPFGKQDGADGDVIELGGRLGGKPRLTH